MPDDEPEDVDGDEQNDKSKANRRKSKMIENKHLKDALDLENADDSSEEDRQEQGRKDMANKIREMKMAKKKINMERMKHIMGNKLELEIIQLVHEKVDARQKVTNEKDNGTPTSSRSSKSAEFSSRKLKTSKSKSDGRSKKL